MTAPDDLTEPLRRATRPLEELPRGNDGPWWECARCEGPVEALSQGHYGNVCRVTLTRSEYHFCCPARGCELQAPLRRVPGKGTRQGQLRHQEGPP